MGSKINRDAFVRGVDAALTLAPLRLLFWRLVRDLAEHVMDAGYGLHWFARGRITAAHEARRVRSRSQAGEA